MHRKLALRIFTTLALTLPMGFNACSPKASDSLPLTAEAWPPIDKVLRVALSSEGRIFADGREISFEALNKALRGLSDKEGTVWFYRETGSDEPPIHAADILQSIVSKRLAIRLSARADFSDFPPASTASAAH